MQNLVFYVAAGGPFGKVKDYANAKTVSSPTMILGAACCLRMRLFSDDNHEDAFPLSDLAAITSWSWQMDKDFDASTTCKIVGDNADIYAHSVQDTINGSTATYTEIVIPISDMLTEELVALIGSSESVSLSGELCGYDQNADLVFIIQIKGFTVRNRISATGDPTDIDPEYLTEAQVRALVYGGFDVLFCETASTTSSDWHTTQTASDRYIKFRLTGNASAPWSNPVALVQGRKGDKGDPGSDGTGMTFRGEYDSSVTYQKTSTSADAVQYNGSLWAYVNETPSSGNPPPSIGTSNTYWTLLVAQGPAGHDASLIGASQQVSSLTSGYIVVTHDAAPVALKTSAGNMFPLEKGTYTYSSGTWTIDPAAYLAYEGTSAFAGPWTVYFAGGSTDGQGKANVGLDNITSAGKGVIVDAATELDWDNAEVVSAVNTEYTASKSGIVLIRAQGGSASYDAGILLWGPNQDGSDTGSNYIGGTVVSEIAAGAKSIVSAPVPKGSKYMCYLKSGATLLYAKFVPFKNSIANS